MSEVVPERLPTQHEHAREIRERLGYQDFAAGELELWSFVASRVWSSVESRRALFDRAVVWLLRRRVLLPGISVLWYKLGITNPWIKTATDPPFTRNSLVGCYSVDELAEWISGTAWAIGTAFYYRDLCFIQPVEGGDEWLTIRHGIAFESMTLNPSIKDGSFTSLVRRLLTASTEQCQRLEY